MSGPGGSRRSDAAGLVIAAMLAVVAGIIGWETSQMPAAAAYARIGPTAFPYAIAAGFACLAVGTVVSAIRGGFPEREHDRIGPILRIVGGLVAQLVLLTTAGFSIATGALFAMTARSFGRGPLWLTFPIGVAVAFVIWVIFARGLQLSLPQGPLERLVP